MRVLRLLAIVLLIGILVVALYAGWNRNTPNQFEAALAPGGNIAFDLSAGGYRIEGTNENRVWVEINSRNVKDVHCNVTAHGTNAKVRIDGPSDNFKATIYVPQRSDLVVDQTIGNLDISGVVGNKSLALGIGRIHVEVPAGASPSLDGSVIIGSVRADMLHVGKGGFFRSIESRSNGPKLKAHVDIGDLEIASASQTKQPDDVDNSVPDENSDDNNQ
jgi:hypothetical protein